MTTRIRQRDEEDDVPARDLSISRFHSAVSEAAEAVAVKKSQVLALKLRVLALEAASTGSTASKQEVTLKVKEQNERDSVVGSRKALTKVDEDLIEKYLGRNRKPRAS